MELAHDKGIPPMRPIFFDYKDDAKAWSVEDQYMFGPDILVAPILYTGMRSRNVYLPDGYKWINAWTKQVYDGGQSVYVDAPIEQIPLFIRAGANLNFLD